MSASGEDDKGVEATNTADGTCDMEVQKDATTESAEEDMDDFGAVSYTHLRAHET